MLGKTLATLLRAFASNGAVRASRINLPLYSPLITGPLSFDPREGRAMARKRHRGEDVLKLLREIEVHLATESDATKVCRKARTSMLPISASV